MSDTTAAPAAPTPAETAKLDAKAPAQETDWKAEARKWEQRAKENSAAAKRLAELEEAAKTEEQKRAEELEALRAKVTEYETREQINAWKADVSKETGVPSNVLAGSTLEEIKAHAEQLRPLIAAQAPVKPAPLIVPAEGKTPPALNSSALEDALRKAVGAN